MAETGQQIQAGEGLTLRLVRTAADTDGELLEMEATYRGDGGLPPEHLHPSQTERFEVLQGAVATVIGKEQRVYRDGESFEVAAGTPHQMAAEGPARVLWQVRPALRTAEFFEALAEARAADGPDRLTRSIAVLTEFAAEIRLTGTPPAD